MYYDHRYHEYTRMLFSIVSVTGVNGNLLSRPEQQGIIGSQPCDKAAMLVVNTREFFLEEFT